MSQAPKSLNPELSALDRFGAELRTWRERAGLSQAALARIVHVHPDLIAKVEKAVRRASRELAVNCDTALGAGGSLVGLWVPPAADARRRPLAPALLPVGTVVEPTAGGVSVIRLDTHMYRAADLAGIDSYSHIEVVCYLCPDPGFGPGPAADRPARDPAPRRVGFFARPVGARANRISVSRCRLVTAVDVDLHVLDLTAAPGTPVLDLAPCPAAGGPGPRLDADPGRTSGSGA